MHSRLFPAVYRCAWKQCKIVTSISWEAYSMWWSSCWWKQNKEFICENRVSLETLVTTVQAYLCQLVVQRWDWWAEYYGKRVIGQSRQSESTNDPAHSYLKTWVQFWILPSQKYWKWKRHVKKYARQRSSVCWKSAGNKIGIHWKSWEKGNGRLDQPWF